MEEALNLPSDRLLDGDDVFILLCTICSLYFVSLCCFVYCLCVTVHCTTDTGCQPNCSYQIYLYLYILVAALLARSQYPEGPATGHIGTDFLGFPVPVYKRMLRWFPRLQVATVCFSCSPPDLNFLAPYFIFMYTHNNHSPIAVNKYYLFIINISSRPPHGHGSFKIGEW